MTVQLFEPIAKQRASSSVFPLREDEPEYAKLASASAPCKPAPEANRYGQRIALYDLVDEAVSLNINGVSEPGFNPDRHKQHAFHFTADNCIGCHACESACSEKNDLPPHLSFRSVGYVEGGSYPNYTRMNISMACNHCDDPVCLKGCPTRAYTKHAEYGAVIQDPDICFGCGYCTWVCPYNAPQLDPVKGQVEKCNMCVDRLEVGLKPACVSACLGNALNFGVVESTPANREQIAASIPGFPDPDITHPNIRFQQTKTMPMEVTRPDSAPVKYRRDSISGQYKPTIDRNKSKGKSWNLAKLSSRENPLVAFTLASQAAIGLFGALALSSLLQLGSLAPMVSPAALPLSLLMVTALIASALLMSASHLGKPFRAYRGFNNLRHSPMAREGFGAMIFMLACGLTFIATLPSQPWLQGALPALADIATAATVLSRFTAVLALLAGGATLYYMVKCYLIKARPFWNHWQTATSFLGASAYLGGIFTGLGSLLSAALLDQSAQAALVASSALMLTGLALEALGLTRHAVDMTAAESEGAVSHYVQRTTFGKTYQLRNALLALTVLGLSVLLGLQPADAIATPVWLALATLCVLQAVIGRALFYVLVIPTTMPGAFFWKNKGFEQHARDIGLADMPQVGVAPEH